MLCEKNDSQSYIRDFQKRFNNFAEKAPILISYSTHPGGVSIIDEGKNVVYDFDWDFTIPVKTFIHGIKELLSEKAYPRIHYMESHEEPLTEEEAAGLLASGVDIDQIPNVKNVTVGLRFMIDKCIIFKDIFILKDLKTGELFRYKLNKSSVVFLKKLRSGALNETQAGTYFFQNATFLNKIESKEEDGSS